MEQADIDVKEKIMLKRIIAAAICLAVLIMPLASCSGGNIKTTSTHRTDGTPAPIEPMGDADGNGKTDEADHVLFVSYLMGDVSEIHYEFCDLNGDLTVDEADAELLRSYLDGEEIEITGSVFAREDADVTDELCDLGINNGAVWSGNKLIARNPFDMISSDGFVMVSGGDYNSNRGPIIINGYTKASNEPTVMGSLDSEQINRFYDCGDLIAAVSIDQRSTWGFSDLFIKPSDSDKWGEINNVLVDNIHCYDMVYFNGVYFFCGSNVSYKTLNGVKTELYKPSLYRSDAPLSENMTAEDFVELEAYNENGYLIDFTNEVPYTSTSRFYELFVFGNKLYAFCTNGYDGELDEKYDYNGIYVYDEDSDEFVEEASLDYQGLKDIFGRTTISHDFEFGGKYYFISSTLFCTEDLLEYSQFIIEGYENYAVKDVIFRENKAYLLVNEKQDGHFVNAVLETSDFESFRAILHFESGLFARSFEFCNGSFYFGLGYDVTGYISENLNECGRIYRYDYYD